MVGDERNALPNCSIDEQTQWWRWWIEIVLSHTIIDVNSPLLLLQAHIRLIKCMSIECIEFPLAIDKFVTFYGSITWLMRSTRMIAAAADSASSALIKSPQTLHALAQQNTRTRRTGEVKSMASRKLCLRSLFGELTDWNCFPKLMFMNYNDEHCLLSILNVLCPCLLAKLILLFLDSFFFFPFPFRKSSIILDRWFDTLK